jgi:hypothetical protein
MKLNKFSHIRGTLTRTLKNKTREETQIKFDKVMAVPMVLNQKEYSSFMQKWFIYSQLKVEQD